jgi:hypothetical protein
MDDADRTAERQEREEAYLIRAAKKPDGPQPSGNCHWCGEPTKASFCDSHCRDDWEHEQKRKKVNGS